MSYTGKRARNVLSIETKIEIINRLEKGEMGASLAKIYNVGKATISDIKLKKETILNFAAKCDAEYGSRKRKTMKKPQDEQLEEAVYSWFVQRRNKGLSITGPLLCEKALEFNARLEGSPYFKASNGWLKNFKTRHGIRGAELLGKSSPVEGSDLEPEIAVITGFNGLSMKQHEGAVMSEPVPSTSTGLSEIVVTEDGLSMKQHEGAVMSEPVPSTSAGPSEIVVTEDECMEREDLASIKYEEVFLSEDEEKEITADFHDYSRTAMTDITDHSADLQDPLPIMGTRHVPEPTIRTATSSAETVVVQHEAPNTTGSALDVNELFAKYLVAELRSLHPDDAALLRKRIHCLVADFVVYETGSRAAGLQESSVSGSEHHS